MPNIRFVRVPLRPPASGGMCPARPAPSACLCGRVRLTLVRAWSLVSAATALLCMQIGGQMWYLQDRAKDAIKGGTPIAVSRFNEKAVAAGRNFDPGDDE